MTACSIFANPIKFVFVERNEIGCVALYSVELTYRSGDEKNLSTSEGKIYKAAADPEWKWMDTGKAVRFSEWCDAQLFKHEFEQARSKSDFEVDGA